MKKAIFLLLLTTFLLSTVSAIDIDGSVSSATTGKTASIKTINIHETTEAKFGIKFPLDYYKNTNLKISLDAFASWQVNDSNSIMNLNCSELSLIMSIPLGENSFGSFEMGRFSVKDCTNLILDQNLDGVRFLMNSPAIQMHLYGGYTGLLNARNNPMLPASTATGLYPLAPPFITADFYIYMPDIYEDKSIGLEFLGAINPTTTAENKIYGMVRMDGEFLYFIPYTLCSAFVWTNENNSFGHMANLSFGKMEYTINSIHFGGLVLHASGNTDNFSHFKQLSAIYADKANSILYSNLIKVGAFMDQIIYNDVKLAADAYLFINLQETTKNILINGFQWSFDVSIPFIQKSKLMFNVSQFLPFNDGQFNTTLGMFISYGF